VGNDANLFPGGILTSVLCNTVVHLTPVTDPRRTSSIVSNCTWLTTSLHMAAIPDHPDSAGYYIARWSERCEAPVTTSVFFVGLGAGLIHRWLETFMFLCFTHAPWTFPTLWLILCFVSVLCWLVEWGVVTQSWLICQWVWNSLFEGTSIIFSSRDYIINPSYFNNYPTASLPCSSLRQSISVNVRMQNVGLWKKAGPGLI
jgi:hypothetical protein